MGVAGYIMVLLEMFGMSLLFNLLLPKGFSLSLLWYGL